MKRNSEQANIHSGKIKYCTILLCVLNNTALSGEGTINITGDIHSNTCTVSTSDLKVTFTEVTSRQFPTTGSSSPLTPFAIELKDCGASSNVAVTFNGTAASSGSPLVALDKTPGAATGLGIAILDDKKNPVPINSTSHEYPLAAGVSTATLDFYAQYTSYSQTVTAGPASASVTFNMTYQ